MYTDTCMMHKRHMSLTRVLVAGNGHTLLCAHEKHYTRDSNHQSNHCFCFDCIVSVVFHTGLHLIMIQLL